MTFHIDQRVRTTVDAPAMEGFDFGAPAGTLGAITGLPVGEFGGYGVLLDGDPHELPAHYDADELEALNPCPARVHAGERMTEYRIAVNGVCLDCSVEILRTEADPGDEITIPDHDCGTNT